MDLGDGSSSHLVWGTYYYGFQDKDLDKALVYADKTLELHGAEARQMQASLSGFPATDPPEETYKYKALNNVGAAVFAKGQILWEKGDRAGAEEAYTMVIQDFGYAQIQDQGEWQGAFPNVPRDDRGFMKTVELAKERLAEIEADKN